MRRERGLAQAEVAARAGVASRSLRRIERGERRTRATTLGRLARAIDEADPDLVHLLIGAAGVALAPESAFADRVDRRRRRRLIAASRRFLTEEIITNTETSAGVWQVTVRRRRLGRDRVVESTTERLIFLDDGPTGRMDA